MLQTCPALVSVARIKGSGHAVTSPIRYRAGKGSTDATTSLRPATETGAAAKSGVRSGLAIKGYARPTPISGRRVNLF